MAKYNVNQSKTQKFLDNIMNKYMDKSYEGNNKFDMLNKSIKNKNKIIKFLTLYVIISMLIIIILSKR